MPVSCARETCRRLSRPHTAGYSRRTALAAPVVEAKEKLVNDRHPSGTMAPAPASDTSSAHYASYGTPEAQYGDFTLYGGYDATGSALTGPEADGHSATAFSADPLFAGLPGDHAQGTYATGDITGTWSAAGHDTAHYDAYATPQQADYGTGGYDTTAWTAGQQPPEMPQQAAAPDAGDPWESGAWPRPDQAQNPADPTQQWYWGTHTFDTGAYDAAQWNSDGSAVAPAPDAYEHQAVPFDQQATATFEQHPAPPETAAPDLDPQGSGHSAHDSYAQESYGRDAYEQGSHGTDPYENVRDDPYRSPQDAPGDTGELPAVPLLLDGQEESVPVLVPAPRAATRGGSRARRRTPAKRSALLTVAVPSACVMGVAGIAAASVGDLAEESGGQETTKAAADTPLVQPAVANNQLDTQLESLSAGAGDFADRASRTQERIDLKAQQVADRKAAAEEAARQERLRPKFALPVAQHGLSAYYGQSGINWMSMHTGIDFPVSYGATVMAATDGTVRTQYNSAYGNMMIVTAMDGTETWYCHLSSYQVASGTAVKAGQPIAFSGNSGNSTGPHLHFEVRPAGGSAIDPLAWFRSHGLEPS
ncbi:peptidoglycan DD-metalloendopeptidase family protein [Streptomyces prasinopilosus]|uniref:peptidoglycan DD-metalloendopeptidase family protein n=1 Tax=Streptomyces prasinopilosus TaxID=67344 RepID=UPI00099E7F05|nr:peptidoglycan DD-metalloendopeptidase family protein [Streptomyces prasinopilosus]